MKTRKEVLDKLKEGHKLFRDTFNPPTSLDSEWIRAINEWADLGTTDDIESLLKRGGPVPKAVQALLAHIISGGTRAGVGVKSNHKDQFEKMLLTERRNLSWRYKAELEQKIKDGTTQRLKGVSLNQMVADRIREEKPYLCATERTVKDETQKRRKLEK